MPFLLFWMTKSQSIQQFPGYDRSFLLISLSFLLSGQQNPGYEASFLLIDSPARFDFGFHPVESGIRGLIFAINTWIRIDFHSFSRPNLAQGPLRPCPA